MVATKGYAFDIRKILRDWPEVLQVVRIMGNVCDESRLDIQHFAERELLLFQDGYYDKKVESVPAVPRLLSVVRPINRPCPCDSSSNL